jgi:hypothetical protein
MLLDDDWTEFRGEPVHVAPWLYFLVSRHVVVEMQAQTVRVQLQNKYIVITIRKPQ